MIIIAKILVFAVAAIHIYFGYVEMFAWETKGKKFLSQMHPETFAPSRILAANMGFYNIFIGICLLLGLFLLPDSSSREFLLLFLGFVVLAGLYGGATADYKLALLQSLPAAVAFVLVLILFVAPDAVGGT